MKACEPAATEQLSTLAYQGQDMGYQRLLDADDLDHGTVLGL
jgi:hypothetical protein